ncbi:MAG: AMP-binding protein, partial [bacterium]|nr:AMP-binding protein [bacterium]
RINYILADSNAGIILKEIEELNEKQEIQEFDELGEGVEIIEIHSIYKNLLPIEAQNPSTGIRQPTPPPAYIIYTSGTTGRPKGTVITHSSLINLCTWHNRYYEVTGADKATQYASIAFDAAVWEIYPYLVKGATLHILPKKTKLDIERLSNYYRRAKITISFLPTQFCSQFMAEAGEIPTLRVLLAGGDKLNRYVNGKYKLYNNYGPTENTVVSTSFHVKNQSGNIPIGKPVANVQIYIMNKGSLKLQPPGIAGELCIAGDSLALGYLNNPELTCEKFTPYGGDLIKENKEIAGSAKLVEESRKALCPPEARLYRTGDLARCLPDGNIEFLGRIDHQVKIRGFRIELGEIENSLLLQPEIKETVVISRQSKDGDNFLCAYYVVENHKDETYDRPDSSTFKAHLSQHLPDYMIPTFFIKLEKIPLTSNGKANRKALAQIQIPNLKSPKSYQAPRNKIEEKLNRIWADILDLQKQDISIDDNFFDIGGHSLRATIMASKIHKEFNVKLPLTEIFKNPSIRPLSDTIKKYAEDKYIAIETVEKKEYYVLSSPQKRLYVLHQMEPESTAYNMPFTVPLLKDTDPVKLQAVFKKLIRRHESLRTSFHMLPVTPGGVNPITSGGAPITSAGDPITSGGDPVTPNNQYPITNNSFEIPVQKLHDEVEFEIEYYKPGPAHQETGTGERKHPKDVGSKFFRPFELSKAPLLRVGIIEPTAKGNDNQNGIMMLDMHHIITDGTSQEVLLDDFLAIHAEKNLPTIKHQYKDYAEWQNSREQKELVKQQGQYWMDRFSGELPVLNLPTDYQRPLNQRFEGHTIAFELNKEEIANLKTAAKENETTLYMAILSSYTIVLSKLSGQQDIIVGTPTAGRRHTDLENIIGMFVNTLGMRNYPHGEKTVKEYLKELKENTLQAFENQDYPFEDLVDGLSIRRDTGRNPIFDVMLNLLNQTDYKKQNTTTITTTSTTSSMSTMSTKSTPSTTSTTSKFDLTLIATDTGDSLNFHFEYCT